MSDQNGCEDPKQVYMVDDPYEGLSPDAVRVLKAHHAPAAKDLVARFIREEVFNKREGTDVRAHRSTGFLFLGLQAVAAEEREMKKALRRAAHTVN